MDVSKKDWKLFREKLSGWQEKYMEGLVKLEKQIKEDKRHPGVIMEMRKSDAIWDIVHLIRLNVISYDALSDFSDELQQEVRRILEIS